MDQDHESGRVRPSGLVPSREAVGVDATPSEVSRNDLLRMLVNVTTALSACCDDTLREVLASKIAATHRASIALIERARAEDVSQSAASSREASKRDSARATEPKGDS